MSAVKGLFGHPFFSIAWSLICLTLAAVIALITKSDIASFAFALALLGVGLAFHWKLNMVQAIKAYKKRMHAHEVTERELTATTDELNLSVAELMDIVQNFIDQHQKQQSDPQENLYEILVSDMIEVVAAHEALQKDVSHIHASLKEDISALSQSVTAKATGAYATITDLEKSNQTISALNASVKALEAQLKDKKAILEEMQKAVQSLQKKAVVSSPVQQDAVQQDAGEPLASAKFVEPQQTQEQKIQPPALKIEDGFDFVAAEKSLLEEAPAPLPEGAAEEPYVNIPLPGAAPQPQPTIAEAQTLDEPTLTTQPTTTKSALEVMLQPIFSLPEREVIMFEAYSRFDGKNIHERIKDWPNDLAMDEICKTDMEMCEHILGIVSETDRSDEPLNTIYNMSMETLRRDDTFQNLKDKLLGSNIKTDKLIIEISQKELRSLDAQGEGRLKTLQKSGIRFSLDNITDWSLSLDKLKELGFSFIKLPAYDFMERAPTPEQASALHAAFAEYDLKVILEKVESEDVLSELTKRGVKIGQGYHLAPPEYFKPKEYNA